MAYELDLDALAPKPHEVKLGGEMIEVNPPKFKSLIRLMELSDKLSRANQDDGAEMAVLFSEFQQALIPIIPKLGEDDVDLTIQQVMALVTFVMEIASAENTPSNVEAEKGESDVAKSE
jgi:hypothetical protein